MAPSLHSGECHIAQDLGDFTVYLVGHAHIDLGYRWRWKETVHRVARGTFRLRLAIPGFAIYAGEAHRDDIAPGDMPGFETG